MVPTRIFLEVTIIAVASYLISFILIFVIFIQNNIALLKSYFIWSWTGGGELPLFINLISITISIFILFLVIRSHLKNR